MQASARLERDPAGAARIALEILAGEPGNVAAALLLGTAQRRCGDPAAASEAIAALAAAQPQSAVIQLELGRALRTQGHAAQARAAFERAVQLEPDLAQAWRALSDLYGAAGDEARCDAAFARFEKLVSPDAQLLQAGAALANGRLDGAESLLRRRLVHAADDIDALRLIAQIAATREEYAQAERLLEQCLRLAPGCARARLDLARLYLSQQKVAPMLPLLERVLRHDAANVPARALQASALTLLGDNERALSILAELIDESPHDERAWLQRGDALRALGRTAEAIGAYRRSIDLRAGCAEAWFSLANLKTFRFTPAELETMRVQLARADLSDTERLQLEFALGKALEDAGDFAAAFTHYASGNALRRAQLPYDPAKVTTLVRRSKALYTREFFAQRAGWGCQARDPIFIVGLPRSGSTLVEQILASHSQVEGTRELPDVPAFAIELGSRSEGGAEPRYPDSVAQLTRAQLGSLGERYLEQTRPHRRLGRARFIDKMPYNFAHLGLIHLMLPNARIIDARRAPLACCFANFRQHFQQGSWFTYSLADLGHYYRDYVELLAHFDAVLPGRIHRVHYEALVADLEGEVRSLLDYCGLPFEAQCLRFYETQRVVQTVSSEQVRRPLYSEGVDQWRHFEPWLGELKRSLGDLAR